MRILITKNGKIIVRGLEDELPDNHPKLHNRNKHSSSLSKLPIICSTNDDLFKKYSTRNSELLHKILRYRDTYKNKRSSSTIDKNTIESFYNRDETKINLSELYQAKKVKLSHPKINMSQEFFDKYDNYDLNYKKKLNELTNDLNSNNNSQNKSEEKENIKKKEDTKFDNNNQIMNSNINMDSNYGYNNSSISNKKNKINLGKIISRNNLIDLKKQISKYNKGLDDNRMFLDEQNIKSYNFRSKYENKQATEEDMDLILNYTINPDKESIIKYFQQQKKISPQYIENLLKYDEPQMYKLNKICQMIIRNENENKFNDLKYYKINKNKDKFNRIKDGQNLKALQNLMKKTNSILDDYTTIQNNHNFWRKNGYKDDVMKIKEKYWKKYHVDRFLKNKQKMEINGLTQTTQSQKNIPLIKKLFSSKSTPDIFNKTKL